MAVRCHRRPSSRTSSTARPVDGDDVIEAPAPRPVAGVKKHIGLHVYYRFACSHLTQARVYREKENHVNLYAVLLRFLRLLLHTILKHPDYRTDNSSVKFFIEKTLLEVIGELEYLKPIVQQKRQQQQRNQQEKTTEDNIGSATEPLNLTGNNAEIVRTFQHTTSSNKPQPLDASGTTSSLQKVEPIIHSDAPILKDLVPAKLNQDDLDGHSSTSQYSPTNSHDSRCSVSPEELISRFLNEAVENTTKSLETCGIIAGTLRVDMDVKYFIATDLIIPKQESTSYSREATNEEEILDIFEQLGSPSHLGWIHY
ncbi:AMSH-like ubiquitin thioesterase 1 [Oryza sativa Japonica Group]|uniref:AMSH-like ubiquitin thioesterase 1 n=1 Tax=Oryza sativa subsp. japonica TaxID=39947 RepID=UPI00339C9ACC